MPNRFVVDLGPELELTDEQTAQIAHDMQRAVLQRVATFDLADREIAIGFPKEWLGFWLRQLREGLDPEINSEITEFSARGQR